MDEYVWPSVVVLAPVLKSTFDGTQGFPQTRRPGLPYTGESLPAVFCCVSQVTIYLQIKHFFGLTHRAFFDWLRTDKVFAQLLQSSAVYSVRAGAVSRVDHSPITASHLQMKK